MTTRTTLPRTALPCALLTLAAAGCVARDAEVAHPPELAATWVRLLPDGTWGDTLQYLGDGRVVGAAMQPRPETEVTRWSIVRSKSAGTSLCVGGAQRRMHCQPFRLVGDTLVLGNVEKPTFLRRVR